jgi:hypothetical protein
MNKKNLITIYETFSQSVLTGDSNILTGVLNDIDELINSENSPYIKILLHFLKISYKRGFHFNPLNKKSKSFEEIRRENYIAVGEQFEKYNLPFSQQIHELVAYFYAFNIYFSDMSIIFSLPADENTNPQTLAKYTAYDFFFKKTNFERYQLTWTIIDIISKLNKSIQNIDLITNFIRFITSHGKISVFAQDIDGLNTSLFKSDLQPIIDLYDRYLDEIEPERKLQRKSKSSDRGADRSSVRGESKRKSSTMSSPFISLNKWGAKKYSGYDFSVGRTEDEVFSLILSPESIELSTQFRSPQDTLTDVSDKYIFEKPIVYLLGNNSPSIKWRQMFTPVLSDSFIIYNPDVRNETHNRDMRESDSLINDVAILSADLIIVYIDSYKRNIDVMLETVFLITLGFPVVLIVQDLEEGYYTESRNEINYLRQHIRKLAGSKSIPVYENFSDFVSDNSVTGKYKKKVLSADRLMQTVDPEYISAGLIESIKPFLFDMQNRKIFDLKPEKIAGLFSRKPIYTSVILDYDGTLVSQDKNFSFSVNNAMTINEFFGILNFILFNRLGISEGNIELDEELEKVIRNNFKTLKEEVKIQFLDLSFFDEMGSAETLREIQLFLETDDSSVNPQSFPHYIEIQLVMHFLIELLKKNMNIQYVTTRDYFNEIRKNKTVQNYFKNLICEKDSNLENVGDVDLFVKFGKSYIFDLLVDVNKSRFTLNKFLCLYPEVLHKDTVRGLSHLCRFYNYEYNTSESGVIYLDNDIKMRVSNTTNVNFFVILQEYYNEQLKLGKKQPHQFIIKKSTF